MWMSLSLFWDVRFNKQALLASYQVTHRIAKCEEPHAIAEELTLPAAVDMVTLMIGKSAGFSAHVLMKS